VKLVPQMETEAVEEAVHPANLARTIAVAEAEEVAGCPGSMGVRRLRPSR
jgi:hypothetical protein